MTNPRSVALLVRDASSADGPANVHLTSPTDCIVHVLAVDSWSSSSINAAIRRSTDEFIALADGVRPSDLDWIAQGLEVIERDKAAAVGRLDAHVSYAGFLSPAAADERSSPGPRLFVSRRAAIYQRGALLEVGGFDEEFKTELADLDLGWRLNLANHQVVTIPEIRWPGAGNDQATPGDDRGSRALDGEALSLIYKNYGDESLSRVLPAAIAFTLLRGLTESGIDMTSFQMGSDPPDTVDVSAHLIRSLLALEDFSTRLPRLDAERDRIQRARRASETRILQLFVDPMHVTDVSTRWMDAARALASDLGIDELFGLSAYRSPQTLLSPAGPDAAAVFRTTDLPTVSFVILTALGPKHLTECLPSIRALRYPAELIEVVIVDNASPEDPEPEVKRWLPAARLVRNATNLGFAAGNNVGARAARGRYVVFLNDDTKVDPDFLIEAIEVARTNDARAVGSLITDWSGQMIDFVEGAVNFQGKGFQLRYGEPAATTDAEPRALLFACGCAMLVDRALFLEVGGFDENAFAYYEDVELGWRLNVLGYGVRLAPKSVVRHRHHGTSGQWPEPPRRRLYERNSLRILYSLVETSTLRRVLPAALLLCADRALLESGLSRAAEMRNAGGFWFRIRSVIAAALRAQGITRTTSLARAMPNVRWVEAVRTAIRLYGVVEEPPAQRKARRHFYDRPDAGDITQRETLPIGSAAVLSGLYDFLINLPALSLRRRQIQDRRRISDRQLLSCFRSHWLQPSAAAFQPAHNAAHERIVQSFGISDIEMYSS